MFFDLPEGLWLPSPAGLGLAWYVEARKVLMSAEWANVKATAAEESEDRSEKFRVMKHCAKIILRSAGEVDGHGMVVDLGRYKPLLIKDLSQQLLGEWCM